MNQARQEPSLQIEQKFCGRVFTAELHTVALPDGRTARREIVRHSGGACVLALDDHDQVAMIRQYRKAFEADLLEIPAGKLEPGEDPADCARRELSEETGFTTGSLSLLATLYPSPGYCSEVLSIYLATNLKAGQAHPDDGEHLSCSMIALHDLLDRIDRGEIRDGKTQVALLMLDRLRRRAATGLPAKE
jgi:ADP-ribose pyrophosphatase